MSYSESKITIEKLRPHLKNLEAGRSDQWHARSLGYSARGFAYKIREVLYAASLNSQEYPELARARQLFEIKRVNADYVQAVLKATKNGTTLAPSGAKDFSKFSPSSIPPIKIQGKQTAASIVQQIIEADLEERIAYYYSFPEADLSREDKVRLFNWCHRQVPIWIMMAADSSILVARENIDITRDLGWSPEDD